MRKENETTKRMRERYVEEGREWIGCELSVSELQQILNNFELIFDTLNGIFDLDQHPDLDKSLKSTFWALKRLTPKLLSPEVAERFAKLRFSIDQGRVDICRAGLREAIFNNLTLRCNMLGEAIGIPTDVKKTEYQSGPHTIQNSNQS